ncbi:competence/damage-inducible protein A [bacterium]|nr:competence/damage-inducible protein A [bacterium]
MRTEIVTIGNELLDGSRTDTNASYLASHLNALGADVVRMTSVGDGQTDIEDALREALTASELVIATGGLGPTADDRTKQALARLFSCDLVLNDDALARVSASFAERGVGVPESNAAQCMLPECARPIENRVGSAPGLLVEREGRLLFALPGVPAEMRSMFESYVAPFLEGRGLTRLSEERMIRTLHLAESEIADMIQKTVRRLARVDVAYLPHRDGVDLRIVGRGESRAQAVRAVEGAQERIADLLGDAVYARGHDTIERVVGYLLSMQGKTLAVAESCTGGRVAWQMTRTPGSSEYFEGGVVAYSNELKKRLLYVKAATLKEHGAVSCEVAEAMAEGVRRRAQSDYGLSITGVAGPGGGTPEKPVGLVYVALAREGRTHAWRLLLGGGRDRVRRRAAAAVLDLLRRDLLNLAIDEPPRASSAGPASGGSSG